MQRDLRAPYPPHLPPQTFLTLVFLAFSTLLPVPSSSAAIVDDQEEFSPHDKIEPKKNNNGTDEIREQRQILRTTLAQETVPSRPDNMTSLLLSPDRQVRSLACALAFRCPDPENPKIVKALGFALSQASADELRFSLEQAARPLPLSFGPLASTVFSMAGPETRRLAPEIAALLPPETAEPILISMLEAVPGTSGEQTQILRSLSQVGSARAGRAVGGYLRHPVPSLRAAARKTLDAIKQRLLAAAETELAAQLIRKARLQDPDDIALLLDEALIVGVFQDGASQAITSLDQWLYPRTLDLSGRTAVEVGEAILARAVILFFSGQQELSREEIHRALRRVGKPPSPDEEAALTRARILLVDALLRIDAGGSDESIRSIMIEAINTAPYGSTVPRFDEALSGPFGPNSVASRLRRIGREESRLRFFDLLCQSLIDPACDVSRGLRLESGKGEPAIGSDEAAFESDLVRSWVPCWYFWTLYDAGHVDPIFRHAPAVIDQLEGNEIWNNRLLRAECALILGEAAILAGELTRGRKAFEIALAQFRDVGTEDLRQLIEDRQGRRRHGSPPDRLPHSAAMSHALLGLASIEQELGTNLGESEKKVREAQRLSPTDDRSLVRLALYLTSNAGGSPRATRILDTLPRTSELLLDMSELARKLGRENEADSLFQLHLSWNALSSERQSLEVERARRGRTP